MKLNKLLLALAASGIATSAFATNGMNLEGYGPIAAGMGGASMAYDNGTSAVMNNPATLGLMDKGSRLDVALGMLGPDLTSNYGAYSAKSGGDAYYMPAVGYIKNDGNKAYGVAMFAQGGMGTEYAGTTFMSAGSGLPTRSELGVGRLIFPLSVNVNDKLTVGGSADLVWAMLDLQMAASGAQLAGLATGGTGNLWAALPGLAEAPWVYVNFSDTNDYTGKAKGTGWAGKLGFTYKATPTLTVGGTYHSKTALGDLETSATGASMSASTGFADSGKVTIRDFEWPETYGLGVAYQVNDRLMVALDYKRINWANVMQSFKMSYASAGVGGSVDIAMPQNWSDQNVFELGMAYKATDALTLRVGTNQSKNPIPDTFVNALFPAIMKNHYNAGFGYKMANNDEVNFAYIYAPKVTAGPSASGVSSTMSGSSWQIAYSKRF